MCIFANSEIFVRASPSKVHKCEIQDGGFTCEFMANTLPISRAQALQAIFLYCLQFSNINVVTQNHQGAIMTTLTVKKRMKQFTSTQWQLLLHQPVC
jgi:hypothetical protein